jgi:hypothetical protein
MLRTFVAVLPLVFASAGALAAGLPSTVSERLPGCRATLDDDKTATGHETLQGKGICEGIVEAIVVLDSDICPPQGATLGQSTRIVVRYIEARPGRMNEPFAHLAVEALREGWPCRR